MNHNLQIGRITDTEGVIGRAVVVCEGTVAAAEAAAGDTVSLGGSIG